MENRNVEPGMIIKKVELELAFRDDFEPPEEFDDDVWNSKCAICPFYDEDDERGASWCVLPTVDDGNVCPIKKFFNEK